MLKIFFNPGALETGTNVESQNLSVSEPLVLASETNPERKKLLDEAIQNGGLALTDQFAKSVTKSVVEDIDKNNRVGGAIDLATDTLKDLEVASKVNNYSTAVLDKIVLPSISQFDKDNVEKLDYSDLKFYASLFVTETGKGPIAISIDNFISKNFPKNPDGSYSQKQSWEKFSKGIGGAGIFQLIKQLDGKLGELGSFSTFDLQKSDISNIRRILEPYVNIANANFFDPKLLNTTNNDSALAQNIKDFMIRNQEYGIYGDDIKATIEPAYDNIVWNQSTQKYENHGPSSYVDPNSQVSSVDSKNFSSNVGVATTSSINLSSAGNPLTADTDPISQTQISSGIQTSQPAPDPTNDINKTIVGDYMPLQQNTGILGQDGTQTSTSGVQDSINSGSVSYSSSVDQSAVSGGTDKNSTNSSTNTSNDFPVSGDTNAQNFHLPDSDFSNGEISRKETINYDDGTTTQATINYSTSIDPSYPQVDISGLNLMPQNDNLSEENSLNQYENSLNQYNDIHQNEFKNEILSYANKPSNLINPSTHNNVITSKENDVNNSGTSNLVTSSADSKSSGKNSDLNIDITIDNSDQSDSQTSTPIAQDL